MEKYNLILLTSFYSFVHSVFTEHLLCADLVLGSGTVQSLPARSMWPLGEVRHVGSLICVVKGARAFRHGVGPDPGSQRGPPLKRVMKVRVEGGIASALLRRKGQEKERAHGRPKLKRQSGGLGSQNWISRNWKETLVSGG